MAQQDVTSATKSDVQPRLAASRQLLDLPKAGSHPRRLEPTTNARATHKSASRTLTHRRTHMQTAVAALTRAGLRNPFRVNVAVSAPGGGMQPDAAAAAAQKTPLSLEITYTVVPGNEKVPQLLAFLAAHRDKKVIVYFLTCASVEYFSLALPALPGGVAMPLLALHGGLKQKKVRPGPGLQGPSTRHST